MHCPYFGETTFANASRIGIVDLPAGPDVAGCPDMCQILSVDDQLAAVPAHKSESSCANQWHCQSASLTLHRRLSALSVQSGNPGHAHPPAFAAGSRSAATPGLHQLWELVRQER